MRNLTWVNLSGNQLSGSLPASLGMLDKVTNLYLYNNQFSGSIPTQLGSISSLTQLWLFGNQLSGSIPTEIGDLSRLAGFYIHSNRLTGSIPAEVASLTSSGTGVLNAIGFCDNRLSGAVPTALRSIFLFQYPTSSGYDPIQCQDSRLSTLATASCTDGTFVDLTANPRVTGNNNDLAEDCLALVAIFNAFAGATGNDYVRWSSDLRQWGAAGETQKIDAWPEVTVSSGRVTELKLHDNNLAGTITADYGKLTGLTVLWLNGNRFSGAIPTEIGDLTSLTQLWAHRNMLSGSIPTEIGDLTSLTSLSLGGNMLSGAIPTQIGSLTSLVFLGLSENELTGSIPTQS